MGIVMEYGIQVLYPNILISEINISKICFNKPLIYVWNLIQESC